MHTQDSRRWATLAGCALCVAAFSGSLWAANAYVVRNLTSDIPDLAEYTDPNLKGAGLSTLYTSTGSVISLVVTIPPSKAGGTTGVPTGTVNNSTTGFAIATGDAASFIFDTLDG